METKIIAINSENRSEVLAQAESLLTGGEVVAIPTETVYGLAANAFDDAAVQKRYDVKKRPADNPTIVHISDLIMLKSVVAELPPDAVALAKVFWPGPLTIVLNKLPEISETATCGLATVGVRMPENAVARDIIAAAGVPLAAPSANISGGPSPTTARHVYDDLNGKIPLIIDGGPCQVGIESTVITLTTGVPTILRPGMISLEDIRTVLPGAVLSDDVLKKPRADEKTQSPGTKYEHYSPRANVTLIRGSLEDFAAFVKENAAADTYAICFDGEEDAIEIPSISYGPADAPDIQARKLFSVLRAADYFSASDVFVRAPRDDGDSLAVYNRLLRASGFQVVTL